MIAAQVGSGESRRVEHFWLCGACCEVLDFAGLEAGDLALRPRKKAVGLFADSLLRAPSPAACPPPGLTRRLG